MTEEMKGKGTLLVVPTNDYMYSDKRELHTSNEPVAKLNQWDNPHVAYKGRVYDITDYVNQHPGGREQIMIAAVLDMTQLFHSYHKDHVASLIEKKCKYVGDLVSDEMPAFLPENGKFYQTVTERVTQYFKSNGIDDHDGRS